MSRTLRRHARYLAVGVFSLDNCELAQSAILNQGRYLLAATEETFYEICQVLLLSFIPPGAFAVAQCWPGGNFHRRVYGLSTSQR